MTSTLICNTSWAIFIFYATTIALIEAKESPKSQVEQVPGIIFPPVINRICMIRKNYVCRWTYEKSCSCNLSRGPLWNILDVSLIRQRIDKKRKHKASADIYKCLTSEAPCIEKS